MGDVAIVWNDAGSADLALVNDDLEADDGLRTAVLLSLFTDRRAEPGDELPTDDGDLRGWWADAFLENAPDRYGSRLWQLQRAKVLGDLIPLAEDYDREALAWLIEDNVAEDVEVEVVIEDGRLYHLITIIRPDADSVSFRFAHVWEGEAARQPAPAGSIPPAFVAIEQVTAGGGTGTIVINKPTGVAEGDWLIFAHWGFNSTSRVTVPATDFSEMVHEQRTIEGQQHNFHIFAKQAGPSEPPTYSFVLNGTSAGKQSMMAAYRGASAVDVVGATNDTGPGEANSHTEAGVTTTVDDTRVVTVFGFDNNAGGAWTLGAATGFVRTTRLDQQGADSSMRLYVADGEHSAAGASGVIIQATTPSTVQGIAATLALAPG